jgi:membrane fusion protein (multidrug efflux system)
VTPFPDQTFAGTVIAISPIVDAKTRTAKVRIAPTDPSEQLRGGMSTSVRIQTQMATDAIVIPQGALRERNGQQIVFTADAGVARMNVVRTGVANIAEVQILEGIQPGDHVILPGSIDLTDGLAVAAAPPPTAAIQPGTN